MQTDLYERTGIVLTMGVQDWDWKWPVELQDVPWDCSAASLTWALNAYGHGTSEADVVAGLGPQRISSQWGLLDASGAGLVSYLAELGIPAANNPDATWNEIEGAAGYQPMVIGGREWCHWVGVRMGGPAFMGDFRHIVLLANPAPGYRGVDQALDLDQFEALGPFSAVWFPA
jgi:hypothetical protein